MSFHLLKLDNKIAKWLDISTALGFDLVMCKILCWDNIILTIQDNISSCILKILLNVSLSCIFNILFQTMFDKIMIHFADTLYFLKVNFTRIDLAAAETVCTLNNLVIICPIAIAYSMGQIIKSVCVCQSVNGYICPSASTLAVTFLDRFSPKLAQT